MLRRAGPTVARHDLPCPTYLSARWMYRISIGLPDVSLLARLTYQHTRADAVCASIHVRIAVAGVRGIATACLRQCVRQFCR